jgi:AraC-like DNA-binding protein/AmiR/NasT family two-component response regulator
MVMGDKIRLLWIDLSTAETDAQPEELLEDYFDVVVCRRHERVARRLAQDDPEVVCFSFDYPDRAGSRLVEEMKRLYSSTPMFITTMQHSEELAVWAFRSRMTDFLVTPLQEDELLRCYGVLTDICKAKRAQGNRVMAKSDQVMPASIVSTSGSGDKSLAPALYYVEQHFREKIRCDDVARLCGMSSFRFSRVFKDKYTIAFRDYVVRYRLREAYKMIKDQKATVTDAAFAVGFNDISYFSRMFKRHFEISPSALNNSVDSFSAEDESPTAILRLPLH